MINAILIHNRITGFVFCIIEFGLLAGMAIAFGLYYVTHARFLEGAIAMGIGANALTITGMALYSRIRNEPSVGIFNLFDSAKRAEIHRQYPGLERLTYIIVGATLAPFVLVLICGFEALRPKSGN